MTTVEAGERKKPVRWHIGVFLAPAVIVYSLIMILPLYGTLQLSLFTSVERHQVFVGLDNFRTLFGDPRWSASFWNALGNNTWFFIIHMLVQNPLGVLLAALLSSPRLRFRAFYRTAIFIPTILSFVIVGFVWKLILSPLWGVAPHLLDMVGLKSLFVPWLGKEEYALTALGLISVWQFVGIPMMLIYAALLSIPEEVIEAAECDGITGAAQFWKIKLPLILPAIGIISILTFVGNFNAFDLIYSAQGAVAGPNSSTDILGTFLYRTFFGFQLQVGDPNMGATIASMMFLIILAGVCVYLFAVQTRLASLPVLRRTMSQARSSAYRTIGAHAVLITYTVIALFPVLLVVVNSFKSRAAIFGSPLTLPTAATFDLIGYTTVLRQGDFLGYFQNSLIVTVVSLFFVLLFGAMAGFALSEYRFRGNTMMGLYLALGIMIPIRLGTVAILQLMVASGLVNTLTALIFVYTAQGLPLAIFIMSEFMKQVSDDLKNAGRIDGLSEYTIFFRLVLPLVRPALATVAVFTMIPIWNDLWFPLILAPSEETKTVTLGAQMFIGQFVTNWNAVLAALSLAILPVLILYLVFSRQLIRGITSGAVK